MANDPLDGLFPAESGATPSPEPTPAASTNDPAPAISPEPQPPAQAGQPRDESGRFAPKPGETAPAQVTQPLPQAPVKQPIDAEQFKGYLEERETRQALEKRIADFEARERAAQEQRQQAPIPSIQNDPEGFAAYVAEQTQRAALSTRFDISEALAREKHGDDAVVSAMEWAMQRAQASPQFAADYLRQKQPIDWAVKQQKRETIMADVGEDPDAYVRRRAAELGLIAAPPTEPQPSPAASPQSAASPAKPQPTRSLASAPSAGGIATTVPPEPAFDSVFKR